MLVLRVWGQQRGTGASNWRQEKRDLTELLIDSCYQCPWQWWGNKLCWQVWDTLTSLEGPLTERSIKITLDCDTLEKWHLTLHCWLCLIWECIDFFVNFVYLCVFLSFTTFPLTFLFFKLLTRVPPVMVKALAPTSVSSTSTRRSPVPALTSWSCSLTNVPAKVRTDTATCKHTHLHRLFPLTLKNLQTKCIHTLLSYKIHVIKEQETGSLFTGIFSHDCHDCYGALSPRTWHQRH